MTESDVLFAMKSFKNKNCEGQVCNLADGTEIIFLFILLYLQHKSNSCTMANLKKYAPLQKYWKLPPHCKPLFVFKIFWKIGPEQNKKAWIWT